MSHTLIKRYINNYLFTTINNIISDEDVTNMVIKDVENRLISVISKWNDDNFRKVILFPGVEEAFFYEPCDVELDVKAMVVIAIRNSLIEDISSTKEASKKLGLKKPMIDDKDILNITRSSIEYFKSINIESLSREFKHMQQPNPYIELKYKYPVTWLALTYLSDTTRQYYTYQPLIKPEIQLENYQTLFKEESDNFLVEDIQSGMDMEFSPGLKGILKSIINNEIQAFYVDCFKMISRNQEKLFKLMEMVLRSDAPVVTSNYYISNGYVARRKELLKPSHSNEEVYNKLTNYTGLRKTHLEALKSINKNADTRHLS